MMAIRPQFNFVNTKAFPCIVAFLISSYVIPASLNINAINEVIAQPSPTTPASPGGAGLPTIQITSVQDGQQVPPGELTIQGISSDSEETNCEVFADVNDITPMQNVTAAGESEEDEDFSTWTFTYTEDYQQISEGQNELTAKISCFSDEELDLNSLPSGPGGATGTSDSPLNEWHTVNVTGVVGAPPVTLSSPADGIDAEDEAGAEDGAEGIGESGSDEEDEGDGGDEEDGGIPSLFG
jgi:hypothetical protein